MKFPIKTFLTLITFLIGLPAVCSQTLVEEHDEAIAVTARPSPDSIILRWAPMHFHAWQLGNLHGYRIERHVIARNGSLLSTPERQILHSALRPLAESHWESLVKNEKYAAIAAQALFGDRFEVDLKNSDVLSIVDKIRENEQRFSFALFSADMSPPVAIASGLMFTDRNVRYNEKYLYRITINAGDSLRGSVFISADEAYHLPKPDNLTGDFKAGYVQMRWDKNSDFRYSAYRVERSQDGKNFEPVSQAPLVTVSPSETEDSRYHYAIDSLRNNKDVFYYRVKGLTPFGEESPPSETIRGTSLPEVQQVPYISMIESADNESLHVRWDFPSENNNAIEGFTLERTSTPNQKFISLTPQPLPAVTRTYEDKVPARINYYRVIALGKDGQRYPSPVFYGQLIDSIPPALPEGLDAVVDENGIVEVSWTPNKEADLYGYRVYKANYSSEEMAQLTTSPIKRPVMIDTVDLNTLNEHVYYSVMAIDINQNHSRLSEILKVQLPDKIAPPPPVLLPVKSNDHSVIISWRPAPAEDVAEYAVYRKSLQEPDWKQISVRKTDADTAYYYRDENIPVGQLHFYTVVAIDDARLESDPATAVSGTRVASDLQPAVQWRRPVILREENRITLRWKYDIGGIESFRVYKSLGDKPPVLYQTISGNHNELNDALIPTENYTYRIMAVFSNGQKSALSETLYVDY